MNIGNVNITAKTADMIGEQARRMAKKQLIPYPFSTKDGTVGMKAMDESGKIKAVFSILPDGTVAKAFERKFPDKDLGLSYRQFITTKYTPGDAKPSGIVKTVSSDGYGEVLVTRRDINKKLI